VKPEESNVRKVLVRTSTWYLASLVAILVHIVWAFTSHSGEPLVRVGSLITLFGIMTAARPFIRLGFVKWLGNVWGPYYQKFLPPEETKQLSMADTLEGLELFYDARAIQISGPILIFIGTLDWGYGDLIWNRFWSN
jgi:hypothetical protein